MTQQNNIVQVIRLHPDQYNELRKSVGGTPYVGPTTTELQAGFQLGVEHVLTKLREGFVLEVVPPRR